VSLKVKVNLKSSTLYFPHKAAQLAQTLSHIWYSVQEAMD